MAINISSIYAGEVLDELLVRATTGNELVAGGHIHIQPNVQKKFVIPRMKTSRMLQKRKEQPVEGDSSWHRMWPSVPLSCSRSMAIPRTIRRRSCSTLFIRAH
jgi:hypothetical protein